MGEILSIGGGSPILKKMLRMPFAKSAKSAKSTARRGGSTVTHARRLCPSGPAAGDMEIKRQCQIEINAISKKYKAVADAAGLRQRKQRMTVAGFRAVNIKLDNERKANAPDYQWIKENLPAMCPKSLDGYRRMKNQNTKNYQKIVEAARAMGHEIT